MAKLLILDKDRTLVAPKSGGKVVQNPKDQILLPGVGSAIASMKGSGWFPIIATNQGGVASGRKSLKDAVAETQYAMRLTGISLGILAPSYDEEGAGLGVEILKAEGGNGSWQEVRSKTHGFRKPHPGMLLWFANSDDRILMVGDREEDEQAAKSAGAEFMSAESWRAPF